MMPFRCAVIAAMLLWPGMAAAQLSQKTMQIVVPFAPGASADGIGRIIATELSARLGRQVLVENKPGAGGSLGLMAVAKAPADGDTLAIAATGALVINPHLQNATAFDPLRDLVPIAKLIEIPIVLVANPASGPKSVVELIAQAKTNPGGVSYGSTGVNSGQHLAMEMLKQATGANLVHVPYRGSAPAVTDLLGGQISVASVDLTSAYPHIQAGTLIALGLADEKRSALVPQIPTIAEQGVPGFGRPSGFIGLFAPAGTPAATIRRLTNEIRDSLATADVQARVRQLAVDVAYLDDATFARFLAAESAKWKQTIQSLGVTN
ncbi:MAG: Bug family tripartite tricarboxylate transporter substrate binding protein [Xanthobacteraceae bacterium]